MFGFGILFTIFLAGGIIIQSMALKEAKSDFARAAAFDFFGYITLFLAVLTLYKALGVFN